MIMLDDSIRFQAIDEAALLSALAETEVVRKKLLMYQQLATNPKVKNFFAEKTEQIAKAEKKLRKALKVPEESQWK